VEGGLTRGPWLAPPSPAGPTKAQTVEARKSDGHQTESEQDGPIVEEIVVGATVKAWDLRPEIRRGQGYDVLLRRVRER